MISKINHTLLEDYVLPYLSTLLPPSSPGPPPNSFQIFQTGLGDLSLSGVFYGRNSMHVFTL